MNRKNPAVINRTAISGIELDIDVHDKSKWAQLQNPVLNALSQLAIADNAGSDALSYQQISNIPLATELHFPLRYKQRLLHALVASGQNVVCGEALVHFSPDQMDSHNLPGLPSPVDGTVIEYKYQVDATDQFLSERYITIRPDSEQRNSQRQYSTHTNSAQTEDGLVSTDTLEPISACYWNSSIWRTSNSNKRVRLINESGIKGHGGGGFSLATKLGYSIDTLIVNAIECEPLISCDKALLANEALEIMRGVFTLAELSDCEQCIVALGDDAVWQRQLLEDAISYLHDSANTDQRPALRSVENKIRITEVSGNYPLGAESVLVENLTGFKVYGKRPPVLDGICCVNIATCHAVDVVSSSGLPPSQRIVTICGDAVAIATNKQSINIRVHFGTPLRHVLMCIGIDATDVKLMQGGPLCGTPLQSADLPVQQHTNCIVASRVLGKEKVENCIRCGQCQTICPVGLLPQELNRFINAGDSQATDQLNLKNCLLCGCCDLVCPSNIALTNIFRTARHAQLETQMQQSQALQAEQRFKQRELRLEKRQKTKTKGNSANQQPDT